MSMKRDYLNVFVSLLTFFAGLGMVGLTFWLSYQLVTTPPSVVLKIVPGQAMDLGTAVASLLSTAVKVVGLILMAACGSVVANRGVKLYEAGRPRAVRTKAVKPEKAGGT